MSMLTVGGVQALARNDASSPIVQMSEIRLVRTNRYRVTISDGSHSLPGILSTNFNAKVEAREIDEFCIVKILEHFPNDVHGKRVCVIMNLDVLGRPGVQIGAPTPLEDSALLAAAATTTATMAPTPVVHEKSALSAAPPPTSSVAVPQHAQTKPTTLMSAVAPQQALFAPTSSYSSTAATSIYPISQLNPYVNKWTIKARVTAKTDIRNYNSAKGQGKLFSVDLLDSQGGEIRATMFNEQVDQFYPILEKGAVFLISGGTIKQANKKFTSLKHEYEITFNSSTKIEPCLGDDSSIKHMIYSFCPIADVAQKNKDDIVDVLAVVTAVGDLTSINTKKGDALSKRNVTLLDATARTIELTLWGSVAENFTVTDTPIIAIKAVRVSDYANRSLSSLNSSTLVLNPPIPEAHALRDWYDKQGGIASITTYPLTVVGGGGSGYGVAGAAGGGGGGGAPARFMTLDQVSRDGLGTKGVDMFECEVMVTTINHENTWMYESCPKEDCKKKVVPDHAGGYRCEKCNQTYPESNPRYVLSVVAADATGKLFFSMFNDEAQKLLGATAAQAKQLQASDPKAFARLFASPLYSTVRLKVKAKAETYNDQERVKFMVVTINKVDWQTATHELLNKIDALDRQ